MTKNPRLKMKEKAARVFQRWVCLRDCDAYQKFGMYAQCISCSNIRHFKALQGGHYIDGRGQAFLFEENNCHAQCPECNGCLKRTKKEIKEEYRNNLIKKVGLMEVVRLETLKYQTKDYSESELEELYKIYKVRLHVLGVDL